MGNGQKQRRDGAFDAKRAYASPHLVEYGRVADLIAGGAGSKPEKGAKTDLDKFPD
jgi:hypothetical protein